MKCFICLSVVGIAVLAGCASSEKQASATKTVNAVCPVGGHEVSADVKTVSYKGQTVGFCCSDCVGEWTRMSDAQRDKALASAQ